MVEQNIVDNIIDFREPKMVQRLKQLIKSQERAIQTYAEYVSNLSSQNKILKDLVGELESKLEKYEEKAK